MSQNENGQQRNVGKREERRSFLKKGGILAGLTAFASFLNLTPTSIASAATGPSHLLPKGFQLDANDARQYVSAALACHQYQAFKSDVQRKFPNMFSVQESSATAYHVTSNNKETVWVRIPVSGGAGFSHFVVEFASLSSLIIVMTQGGVFAVASNNRIHAWVEQRNADGQIVKLLDALFSTDGKTVSGTQQVNGSIKVLSNQSIAIPLDDSCGWNCFWNCLVGPTGAPAWLFGFAYALCGTPCSDWLPISEAVCAACLTGALIGVIVTSTFDIGYCIGYCLC